MSMEGKGWSWQSGEGPFVQIGKVTTVPTFNQTNSAGYRYSPLICCILHEKAPAKWASSRKA